jgi:class 3 adenylate cyclase/tetratricopeptide (TPR) repeat protein
VPVCTSCGRESAEDFAFCPHCGAPFVEAPTAREQRKTVTVLFCDLVGSTALGESIDPEALRALLGRYFERMKQIVESHGGSVEKFIGDAVMAVFGVPVVHEDDALRALRAAVEMREAFPALGVQGRIGVTTGEVVTGTEERLATGDAVNVAARLEQAAGAGEILIGDETLRLTRDAVEVELLPPLELKGKAEPVPAHRLLSVHGEEAFVRRTDAPMVGRERELDRLRGVFEQAAHDRSCQLFTMLGAAGVGKSRLGAEFLGALEDVLVVRGRCLPYGEGITYWPMVEVLKQLPPAELDPLAADTLAAIVGDEQLVTSSEEIAWAFRKRLEAVAVDRPLVCVFDDLHWGEETFLDLVEHVADLSRDAPILLLCMARPELLDRRPAWAGGKLNATNILLEPLAAEETEQLIESLSHVAEGLRTRILEAAEGNPLFVEEMVAFVQESGDGEIAVPPTIQALLAARLDQLESSERGVLERGAIEGRVFHRGAVQALSPEESHVTARLIALVRKELVRPDRAQLPGEDAFRFRHLLIRDAAYEALPKATRAELHERFAGWLEEHGQTLVELDEILGYHLEQAARYRAELGLADNEMLASRARGFLVDAARRSLLRQDDGAAVNVLERAAALVPLREVDVSIELDLVYALFLSGKVEAAWQHAGASAERATSVGDRRAELCCRLAEALFSQYSEPEGATERLDALMGEAIPAFEAAGDDLGLYWANYALASVGHLHARNDAELEALEQALVHAGRLGLPHLEARLGMWAGSARLHGRTPALEVIAWVDGQGLRGASQFMDRSYRAQALAMLGRVEEGRAEMAALRADLADRGAAIPLALVYGIGSTALELLVDRPSAAVKFGEEGTRMLEELGERSFLSTAAGNLAQALCAVDRLEEADAWAGRAAELGASDDAITQMLWRQTRAKVLARRGECAEAERLTREAVAIASETDMLNGLGDAYMDLAEVLEVAGKQDEARTALEQALTLYERKGNLVMAERTRTRLAALD